MGILETDLNNYLVTTNYVTQTTGATTLTFQQTLHGLPVANANYNMTVAQRPVAECGGALCGRLEPTGIAGAAPLLSASQAIGAAASILHVNLTSPPTLLPGGDGNSYSASSLSLDAIAPKLQYYATSSGVTLAWNMYVQTTDSKHWYSMGVDASTGGLVGAFDFVSNASYEVYALPGRDPDDGGRTVETNPDIFIPTPATVPSPFGWHDTNGISGAEFTVTRGNNVNAYTDTNADNQPDAGSQPDGGASLDFTGALVPINLCRSPARTPRPPWLTCSTGPISHMTCTICTDSMKRRATFK